MFMRAIIWTCLGAHLSENWIEMARHVDSQTRKLNETRIIH